MQTKVFIGENFKPDGLYDLPSVEYLNNVDFSYDERNQIIGLNLDRSNWQWYFNYLEFVQTLANKNQDASPTWLLDLGYIPIVYMPSCCSSYSTQLFMKMDDKKIPYVKTQPYSFITKYVDGLTADGWVSKMDISKIMGLPPTEITSEKVLKEMILT